PASPASPRACRSWCGPRRPASSTSATGSRGRSACRTRPSARRPSRSPSAPPPPPSPTGAAARSPSRPTTAARPDAPPQPSSPARSLNCGDRFAMPVGMRNQTQRPMPVQVALRATNAAITDAHGRQVTVPANDRVEVRFPAAAEMAGTARFQFAAHSGRFADAAELALPVWTPATTEAFATYGEIDRGAIRQKVAMPKDVVTQFGQLEITTSSTQLQALTDAFLYLVSYPYDCAEQISSRILAVAGLRDVLSAFKADALPSPRDLEKAVTRDIEHLRTQQNPDGGFAFWVRGHESWPYLSIHGGHALTRAKEKGYQ